MSDVYKSGMRGDSQAKQGPLRSVRIEVAENGFLLHCSYDTRDKNGSMVYDDPKPRVFEKLEDALAAAKKELAAAKGGSK